jgi:hypothetical protein
MPGMRRSDVQQVTPPPDHQASASPVACPACGGATFKSFRSRTGDRPPRLDCTKCGRPARHLPTPGEADTPGYVYEPRADDAHAEELKPPAANWQWIGYVRPNDGRWFAVVLAESLESCWDCLLTTHLRGDLLAIPVKPERQGGHVPETISGTNAFVGWHRADARQKWAAVVEAETDGACWGQLLAIRGGDKLVMSRGRDPNKKSR